MKGTDMITRTIKTGFKTGREILLKTWIDKYILFQ